MGKFDTEQLSTPFPQTLNLCNWLGPQQFIAPNEYPHPSLVIEVLPLITPRALQIAALDGKEPGFKYVWPSRVPDNSKLK